ncbi:uncharacterized protein LOC143252910 [Tachypleus tridentatus]|uniref:uncharacterized protein LOC143252910 n=1 Tax=Tachypleus tridentatus TaxID=6853 RepID=UPI003FD29855
MRTKQTVSFIKSTIGFYLLFTSATCVLSAQYKKAPFGFPVRLQRHGYLFYGSPLIDCYRGRFNIPFLDNLLGYTSLDHGDQGCKNLQYRHNPPEHEPTARYRHMYYFVNQPLRLFKSKTRQLVTIYPTGEHWRT